MRELLRRIRFLFHRAEFERDLEEEMRHHVAMLAEKGNPDAAARRQFGNVVFLKEESRSMWTFATLEQLAQDLRYAVRTMTASPMFTATAVLSLALGIGYVAARFTARFVEAFLFGLKPNDPRAIGAAIGILLVAALAAGYLPAWRASRIDPAVALRNE